MESVRYRSSCHTRWRFSNGNRSSKTLQAIAWYAEKGIDFVDAYNAAWLLRHGTTTICSFDRKHFARLEGIVLQVPEPAHG
jgi:predicted nucleic acid-binding protein